MNNCLEIDKMERKSTNKQGEIILGIRKVSRMNFSKLVTLPKQFTDFLDEDMYVIMALDGETLKITPAKTSSLTESEL